MTRRAGAAATARSRQFGLVAMIAVLAVVLIAEAYVQWRQHELLDTATRRQNDALGWSFSQLEIEQLRLRNELQTYVDAPTPRGAERVQLRYDIFVSRFGLVDHAHAADVMDGHRTYVPTMELVHAFVRSADRILGPTPEQPLGARSAREVLAMLDALSLPLQNLSLGASHVLYQRVTERDAAVREQTRLSLALTASQTLLLVALSLIVMRQLRTLKQRRRSLETLADTLQVARRDAEAASRAKSLFLANMSHEIRTPFHGMLGMLSLLQDSGLSPQQAAHLDTARESAQHLLSILNDILDISQLESGKLQVVPQTVDLLQLVAQVQALMGAQAHAKGLASNVEVAPDVPRWVQADPTRVKQILFNLLSNAVKFTASGSVRLDVKMTGDGRLDFVVTDTGAGIDDAMQAKLFQRFMQGDASPSRRAGGAGLGLEISRDLARLMGGDITVHSRPGEGSRFTATLPLPAVRPDVLGTSAGARAPAHDNRPLRVLLAEDHPVNRAYLEAVLEKLGHRAAFAADGAAAVRAVREQPEGEAFDVVLMDLHMPGMDGFEAARAIRAMPAPRGRVPIVALTADAFHESRELARDAGMDGFVTKPAHLPQLREALERHARSVAPASTAADGAPREPSDALLDAATFADLRQTLSIERHAELLAGFLDAPRVCIEQLRRAIGGAAGGVSTRAHAVKGAALSLGLPAIARTAGQLQAAASAADATDADLAALLDRLDRQFDASLDVCRERGLLPPPAQTISGSGSSRMPNLP